MVLPLVTAFVMALVWLLSVGFAQVRVIDAARDAARAVSRGETPDDARAAASRAAPEGADISIVQVGQSVRVEVSAQSEPPGWLLVPLPGLSVRATAETAVEDVEPS